MPSSAAGRGALRGLCKAQQKAVRSIAKLSLNTVIIRAPAQVARPRRPRRWPAGRQWLGGQPPACLHSARRCRCTGRGQRLPSLLPVAVQAAVETGGLQDGPALPEGTGEKVRVTRRQATVLLTADAQPRALPVSSHTLAGPSEPSSQQLAVALLWLSACCTHGQASNTTSIRSAHCSQQQGADCCRAACRLSSNFQEATRLATEPMPSSPPAGHVLVRNAFAGVNASDINYSSGRQVSRLHFLFETSFRMSDAATSGNRRVFGWGPAGASAGICCCTCLVAYTAFVLWSGSCHVYVDVGRLPFMGELPVLPSAVQRQTRMCGPCAGITIPSRKQRLPCPLMLALRLLGWWRQWAQASKARSPAMRPPIDPAAYSAP